MEGLRHDFWTVPEALRWHHCDPGKARGHGAMVKRSVAPLETPGTSEFPANSYAISLQNSQE